MPLHLSMHPLFVMHNDSIFPLYFQHNSVYFTTPPLIFNIPLIFYIFFQQNLSLLLHIYKIYLLLYFLFFFQELCRFSYSIQTIITQFSQIISIL